jgi:competence protein ComEC
MTIGIAALAAIVLCLPVVDAQTAAKPLTIYYIDTEGGHSTLYISPTGESLLEDTGSPGDRDPDRIMAAINDAGLKQIDCLVVTHYHVDHVGGVQTMASRIPIKHFIDHGPTVEPREQVPGFQAMYKALWEKAGPGAHTVVKPGDKIPITGLNVIVVTSAGEVLKKPIAGAPGAGKPNPECVSFNKQPANRDPENAQSVGLVYTYAKFRTINFGDFVDHEFDLMCPNNPIGTVDLYLTPNHGLDQSGPAILVHALRPRVAIMNNGTRKGAAIAVYNTLYSSPDFENLWQLHWSYTGGLEYNAPSIYIANIEDPVALGNSLANPAPAQARGGGGGRGSGGRGGGHTGPAFWIKVTAEPDGTFTVLNTRNAFSKTYAARK